MRKLRTSILALAFLCFASLSTFATAADFKPIFEGSTLNGWDGAPGFWSVKDGAITGQTTAEHPTKGNTFLIWRLGPVDDFELTASYRIVGGNSGIQYRSREIEPWVISGYQGDIEAGDKYSGILYEERARGILAQRGEAVTIGAGAKIEKRDPVGDGAELQKVIKKEDWNTYEISTRGNRLVHKINGHVTIDVIDNDEKGRARSGLLALQLHAGPPMLVQFKDIKLKRLPVEGAKKIVLVGGKPSHALGEHEFTAGIYAINNALAQIPSVVSADYYNGWPLDRTAFDNADAVFLYMDGGGGHPAITPNHLQILGDLMKKGVGLACAHYAVEVPADKGGKEFKEWIGGYYETGYSINPHWDADIKSLPDHPIARGVKPFKLRDEWYYNMRFRDDMSKVTPILNGTPPDDTRKTDATKAAPGREEVLAWAVEREDGGRGFGFTGGHFHKNWGDENFRRLVLNSLLWVAKADVPPGGVQTTLNDEQLNGKLRKERGGR